MRESVLEAFPAADIAVSVAWIHMLAADSREAAESAAAGFDDERVVQFHDPDRSLGTEVARSLGWSGGRVAWDIYLFYERGVRWDESPPQPVTWMHQLFGDEQADRSRYRSGQALAEAMREAAARLLGG